MSASHLSNIECGRKQPSLPLLTAVAKDFDVSLDYLVLGRQDERRRGSFLIFRSDEELLKTFVIVPKGTRSTPPHA